ncbi:ABC transporter substrate-binding protein [Thermodesulfobacteriota bacterium]
MPVEDGKSTLDGITAGATKLVYDHQVKFVVGPQGFFTTASSPVFEQNQVLHVSGYNTCQPGEMDKSTPYGFLGFNAAIGTSIGAFKVIKKEWPDAKRIAVVTADDGAIPYLMPKIKKLLELNGLTMAGDTVGFPNQMEDFSPIAAKLNAIKDADAIFVLNGSPVAVGLISKGLVDSLYGPATLGGQETYGLKNHAIGHPMSYSKLVNGKVVYGGWVDVGRIP